MKSRRTPPIAVMISRAGHIQIGARVAHIPALNVRLRMAAALARIDSRRSARRSRAMSLVAAEAVADEGESATEVAADEGESVWERVGSVDSSAGSVDHLGAWGSSG
ncbi:hypothetical protein GCM10009689_11540 [Brevibacterium antiquum]